MRRLVFVLLATGCVTLPAPRVESDEPFVCRYRLNSWFLSPATLTAGTKGPVFAKVERASEKAGVVLTLPHGDASQGARLQFTSGWVTFNVGYLPNEPLTIYTRLPLRLSPVLTWGEGGRLTWTGSDGGRLKVVIRRPEALQGEPVPWAIRCEDTKLGWSSPVFPKDDFDEDQLPSLRVPAGTEAPIAASPGGAVVEQLLDAERAIRVRVLAEEGAFVKVRARMFDGRVEGWTSRALLVEPTEEKMSNVLGLLGAGTLKGRGTPDYARCAAKVPFSVRVNGEVFPLGEMRRNAAFILGERADGFVEVELPELDWVKREPDVVFLLTERDAARCRGGR